MNHCRRGATRSHSPQIILEMARDMLVPGNVRNKPTWRYMRLLRLLGCGTPLGAIVMVEATSSTSTTNKEQDNSHQKFMAEAESRFQNITTMMRNTTECINRLDTCFWRQLEEYCQELKTMQAEVRKPKCDLE